MPLVEQRGGLPHEGHGSVNRRNAKRKAEGQNKQFHQNIPGIRQRMKPSSAAPIRAQAATARRHIQK